MKRIILCGAAVAALSACQPSVPDSAAGVGFGDYGAYQQERAQRDAALTGGQYVPPPATVTATPLDGTEAQAAAQARALNSGVDPVNASPQNPAPAVVTNSVGLSGENDFAAVSNQRTIKDDAARIAQNRAQYTVVQPTELPSRPGTTGPNIVEFALATDNPKGVQLYKRSSLSGEARYVRACRAYESSDMAQIDFLSNGGPERDRKGVDPDGDGYACDWDPAPFRLVRQGAGN
ncbi:hypothetical protein VK792_01585 [Mesobacterium sp. TK19101]|uniref:Excalibur calcium-binding domain-containing protein n=1 Tax=Mesobacterium hydrothermale TaxID=3111907 RepID=A0ABU6HBW9_9RHOB|nr:hypothetical protein [Mesobacterium sp. TK19101]MEC3859964.1 hypothetical protein [Mesobacterium sp. TK19101]